MVHCCWPPVSESPVVPSISRFNVIQSRREFGQKDKKLRSIALLLLLLLPLLLLSLLVLSIMSDNPTKNTSSGLANDYTELRLWQPRRDEEESPAGSGHYSAATEESPQSEPRDEDALSPDTASTLDSGEEEQPLFDSDSPAANTSTEMTRPEEEEEDAGPPPVVTRMFHAGEDDAVAVSPSLRDKIPPLEEELAQGQDQDMVQRVLAQRAVTPTIATLQESNETPGVTDIALVVDLPDTMRFLLAEPHPFGSPLEVACNQLPLAVPQCPRILLGSPTSTVDVENTPSRDGLSFAHLFPEATSLLTPFQQVLAHTMSPIGITTANSTGLDPNHQAPPLGSQVHLPNGIPSPDDMTPQATPEHLAYTTPRFKQTPNEHTGLTTAMQRLCLDSARRRPSDDFVAFRGVLMTPSPMRGGVHATASAPTAVVAVTEPAVNAESSETPTKDPFEFLATSQHHTVLHTSTPNRRPSSLQNQAASNQASADTPLVEIFSTANTHAPGCDASAEKPTPSDQRSDSAADKA